MQNPTIDPNIYKPAEVSYLTNESTEFRDQFYTRIKKAPESIEIFLYARDTHEAIRSICDRFQLAPTQAMYLTCIIRDVAVALTYYGDMPQEIQTRLDVPEDKAKQIAQAVTELYDFALEDIKKLQVQTFPDRIKGGPTSSTAPNTGNVVDLRK